jgi:adenosylhomocysteine nucleosidase
MASPVELTTYGGKRILFVMAARAEYGPHLSARFKPLITGVGPVEAAVVLSCALARLACAGTLPDLVVSLGSAGSRVLEQTAVYQVSSVSYRDMDASALGFAKGQTPFLDIPVTLELLHRIDGMAQASLSTGANIVSGAAYDSIDADMVDMETFALLRACQLFGVPLIGLRGISDGASELQHVGDWTEYLHVIDEKLANAVDSLAIQLEQGSLAL